MAMPASSDCSRNLEDQGDEQWFGRQKYDTSKMAAECNLDNRLDIVCLRNLSLQSGLIMRRHFLTKSETIPFMGSFR
jgi:hypothetical protein